MADYCAKHHIPMGDGRAQAVLGGAASLHDPNLSVDLILQALAESRSPEEWQRLARISLNITWTYSAYGEAASGVSAIQPNHRLLSRAEWRKLLVEVASKTPDEATWRHILNLCRHWPWLVAGRSPEAALLRAISEASPLGVTDEDLLLAVNVKRRSWVFDETILVRPGWDNNEVHELRSRLAWLTNDPTIFNRGFGMRVAPERRSYDLSDHLAELGLPSDGIPAVPAH